MTSVIDREKIFGSRTFDGRGNCLFLPRPWLEVAESAVQRDQPIRAAAGEIYRCQYLHRIDQASVFARGSIRRPDAGTIWLPYWHRIVMV